MPRPARGIRVLDLSPACSRVPGAAQNLADLGAEVIKVERPKKGDDSRAFGPPWLKDARGTIPRVGVLRVRQPRQEIRDPRSRDAKVQAIARELAERSDVLLENFKYGDLDRYGLGYAQLRKVNPGLIYCSVTGFGTAARGASARATTS